MSFDVYLSASVNVVMTAIDFVRRPGSTIV